jgi:hypothetical protein
MTAVIPLGTFTQVQLREAWPNESGNFTPWLAAPENLKLLAEALELGELLDQQTEVRVGSFLIDILAVDGDGDTVIVENQLETTDHSHLGQLLTYLAGQEGKSTVVWIAERFREEHRAAIDWLNTNTTEDYAFFGVELELWKIGSSSPAPRFNVVAKPNQWTKNIRDVTREPSDPELKQRHQIRLAFWQSFAEYLRGRNAPFRISRPSKYEVHRFPIGRPGFRIAVRIGILRQVAIVGLAISRDPDRAIYRNFLAQKSSIERDFGEALSWDEKPGKKRSLIYASRHPVDPADTSQYDAAQQWMLDTMKKFRATFEPLILALPASQTTTVLDETDDPEE